MKWFKNPFKNKSNSDIETKSSTSFLYDPSASNGVTAENIGFEGYSINASANSAINKIISAIIQMKLFVTKKGDEEEVPIENKLSALLNNPDGDQSQAEWLTEYFGYLLTFGNTFILRNDLENGLNAGQAFSLKVLSQRVIDIITKETIVGLALDRYEFVNAREMPIDEENVLHGKKFNPLNQVIGLSPLISCGLDIDQNNGTKRWNNSLLDNGVNPAGVYTVEGELTPAQFRRFQNQLSENSGVKNAGKEKLLEGGLDYKQTGINPKDTDFNQGQLISKREIASVFQIAPQLIGDTESQTFANYEQAILSLHNDTAFPLLEELVGKLNNWLVPSFGDDLIIKIDTSGVEALTEQKHRRWDAIDKSNELNTDEKRNEKGFDELEDEELGKAIIVGNHSTLSTIVENPQPSNPFNSFGGGNNNNANDDDTDEDEEEDDDDKSIKGITRKEYLKIQHKAITDNEDDAMKVSHRVIAGYFRKQLKEIVKNVQGMTSTSTIMDGVEAVIQQTTDDLQDVYSEIYKDISFDFSLKARFEGKQSVCDRLELKEDLPSEFQILDNFKSEFGSYVDHYFVEIKIADLISKVNDTTKSMVQKIVISGVKEGASVFEITKDIQKMYGNDMELWRAERIARTETLRGMSYAQHESQRLVSPTSKKVWMDAGDDRVRPTSPKGKFNHRNADIANGKIDLNTAFKVSDQSLMFPRDTSIDATAGNVINCRCTVGYIDERFEEFFQ